MFIIITSQTFLPIAMSGLFVVLTLFAVATSHGFKIQPKILNGIKADPSDYPFHAMLNFPKHNACGGSIISDRWILTAAHCFESNKTADVFLGWGEIGTFLGRISVEPENFYAHPDFIPGSPLNDIGLLKLPKPIPLGGKVQAAKLPTDCRPVHHGNIPVVALGTGQYTIQDSEMNKLYMLRKIEFMTAPTVECEPIMELTDVDHKLICAKVKNGQSIFLGDSGGPIINADDGTVIGVTDTIYLITDERITDPQQKCLVQGFSNIRYHFKWISQVTGLTLPEC